MKVVAYTLLAGCCLIALLGFQAGFWEGLALSGLAFGAWLGLVALYTALAA